MTHTALFTSCVFDLNLDTQTVSKEGRGKGVEEGFAGGHLAVHSCFVSEILIKHNLPFLDKCSYKMKIRE